MTENEYNKNAVETQGDESAQNQGTPGWQIGLGVLAGIAFWGLFIYAVWAKDMELVKVYSYIIAVGAGIFGTIHFVSKFVQHISK